MSGYKVKDYKNALGKIEVEIVAISEFEQFS